MLLIKNGAVVSSEKILKADILIEKGKIVNVKQNIQAQNAKIYDASGLLILPGAIDIHVHFRDPEDTSKEDFSSGSASALSGGVTTVIDMPNYRNPPTTTIRAYQEKREIASKKSRCDFLLRFGGSETNFEEASKSGAPQLKIFLSETNSELTCSKQALIKHFSVFPLKKPICVHAEDKERIEQRKKSFLKQNQIQDKISAQIASSFVLEQAKKFRRRVHLCHLTTAKEVLMCRNYKNATYEITPNHLFLSEEDLENLGYLGKINPPLRSKRDQKELWKVLGDDTIIASDHAPHLISHKLNGAPGFPGVGTLLPLMLDAAYKKRLTIQKVVKMCCENPANFFGLNSKGFIKKGKDADLVLIDFNKSWKISADNRFSKCGWTPFEGREVFGKINAVFLRGNLAYENDLVISKPGFGKEIKSKIN